MTVAQAVAEAGERLEAAGCESPAVDAELLVSHVVGLRRSELVLEAGRELAPEQASELDRLIARRELREPLAYVLGEWGFRRLVLQVDARVLVPRPETEILVERCLERMTGIARPRVLDVGTGSGAIALAVADERPGARVTGIDVEPAALEVAGANAARLGLPVELVAWDLFAGLPPGPWDAVVSNPPYVLPEELDGLQPEVRDWEPRTALVGVGATEAVARGACDVLGAGRAVLLEVAAADAGRAAALLRDLGYVDVVVTPDLAGRERVVEGTWPG